MQSLFNATGQDQNGKVVNAHEGAGGLIPNDQYENLMFMNIVLFELSDEQILERLKANGDGRPDEEILGEIRLKREQYSEYKFPDIGLNFPDPGVVQES